MRSYRDCFDGNKLVLIAGQPTGKEATSGRMRANGKMGLIWERDGLPAGGWHERPRLRQCEEGQIENKWLVS